MLSARNRLLATAVVILGLADPCGARGEDPPVTFAREFAPDESWIKPVERPYRQEVCLNGRWQFQPIAVPAAHVRDIGVAPQLPAPEPGRWESVPIKIPSPWNVNTWGAGRDVGAGTAHPYWPSSVYYPSYPRHWDQVEMGWLKRSFRVPASWGDRRIILHFEAVGGHAQVLVNGRIAGEHFDRFLPFELDITELVRRDSINELLVGVRAMKLFDRKNPTFKFMRAPYPPGSTMDQLAGIWQDVFLLGLPPVRAEEAFAKPLVNRDTLEVEVSVKNDSGREATIDVGGSVQPWVNLAGQGTLLAPEPRWRQGAPVMKLAPHQISLRSGETRTVTLSVKVDGRLKPWSPETPSLYGLVVEIESSGRPVDRHFTRFGWRQFAIKGRELLLNGQKIQMFGDLLHPFGPFINSRRYVWAWYRMIKDMHGNAVRPHAQPHPRHFLDLADEMGLLVLDETAIFGSSLQLDFQTPAAWDRYAAHFDALVLRDRNHPSVFGWSFGNELFAIFLYDKAITPAQTDAWYGRLAELGNRSRRLDPTRDWISCDGDEDLRGTLPVWSKHFGHGLPPPGAVPVSSNKPLVIGESGGSYYARASQLAEFNGDRAFESYLGRNEALAIDLYDNIVKLARAELTFFSAAETAWFGLEHLNFGYRDFTRLPKESDGVWFPPFEEGKPGVQPERLPPYVCTLNPGWDPALPLYKPLPMFLAQQAAQAPGGPQPSPWDHKPALPPRKPAAAEANVAASSPAGFVGARDGELYRRLSALGVALAETTDPGPPRLLVVDAGTLDDRLLPGAQAAAVQTQASGGTVLVMFGSGAKTNPAVDRLVSTPVSLSSRRATSLVPRGEHPLTAGLGLADLDFSEDPTDALIIKCGLDGPLVVGSRVLLEASNTDWSLFGGVAENAKCAAVLLSERMAKPSGSAMVAIAGRDARMIVSSIDVVPASIASAAFWRRLFSRAGVRVGVPEMIWLVPAGTSGSPGATWRYVVDRPEDNWREPGFDDAKWRSGTAGFGSPDVLNAKSRTPWNTADIWLRTTFDWSKTEPPELKLWVYHDEDITVYLNGVLALSQGGHVTDYHSFDLPIEARAAIKPGRNLIAVHCVQTAGAQFVDVGLGRPAVAGIAGKRHDLLLDGPPAAKP